MNACNSSGGHIPAETKLLAALRWLAGGSYWDIALALGVSYDSFFFMAAVFFGKQLVQSMLF